MISFLTSAVEVGYVSDEDKDLSELIWSETQKGYLHRWFGTSRANRKHKYLHKIVLERKIRRPLNRGEIADHIDRNPRNNQRDNLRLATYSQNSQNKKIRKDNTSGYRGIYRETRVKKESWIVAPVLNGKKRHIGTFNTKEEAKQARDEAVKRMFGAEFVATD